MSPGPIYIDQSVGRCGCSSNFATAAQHFPSKGKCTEKNIPKDLKISLKNSLNKIGVEHGVIEARGISPPIGPSNVNDTPMTRDLWKLLDHWIEREGCSSKFIDFFPVAFDLGRFNYVSMRRREYYYHFDCNIRLCQ